MLIGVVEDLGGVGEVEQREVLDVSDVLGDMSGIVAAMRLRIRFV